MNSLHVNYDIGYDIDNIQYFVINIIGNHPLFFVKDDETPFEVKSIYIRDNLYFGKIFNQKEIKLFEKAFNNFVISGWGSSYKNPLRIGTGFGYPFRLENGDVLQFALKKTNDTIKLVAVLNPYN